MTGWRVWTSLFTVSIATAASYAPAVRSLFVKDDVAVMTSARLDFPEVFLRSWPGGFYRPAAELAFGVQYQLFGFTAFPYHVVSVFAHLAAVYVAFHIFSRLLGDDIKALAAAALFAVHPLNTESVSWISGQMSLFAGLFSLLCIYLFSFQQGPLSWKVRLSGIAFFVLALGFYESSVIVLPLIVAYAALTDGTFREWKTVWLLVGIVGLYACYRFLVLELGGGYYTVTPSVTAALTNLSYYGYLLFGGTAIGGRIVRYDATNILCFENILEIFTPFLLTVSALFLLAAYRHRYSLSNLFASRRSPAASSRLIPFMWILVALLPTLVLPERPRRLSYLAVPGFALLVTDLLFTVQKENRSRAILAKAGYVTCLVAALLTLHGRNQDWRIAGNIESDICSVVRSELLHGTCSRFFVDVPNLVGDALLFNEKSVQGYLRNMGIEPSSVPLSIGKEIEKNGGPNEHCYVALAGADLQLERSLGQVTPLYGRGHNWRKSLR